MSTLMLFLILTACGGKKNEQSNNNLISSSPEAISEVRNHDTISQDSVLVKIDNTLICFDYSEAESFNLDKDAYNYRSYTRRDKNYLKGKTKISKKNVSKNLFGGLDSIDIENIWSGEIVDKVELGTYISSNDFYLIDTIFNSEIFLGIVYEAMDDEGSIKYFSTINKKGKFISRISIACYLHSGSYTAGDGSRPPWYGERGGCINKDTTIVVNESQAESAIKYKIYTDGKIVETKPDPLLDPKSKESFEKILMTDSNNSKKHLEYADILIGRYNDRVEAKKHYEKALQINPKFADANIGYAWFMISHYNDTSSANKYFKKGIEIAPNISQYHSLYAFFLSEYLKDNVNAKKQFEKAIEVNPNDEQAHLSYADFLYEELNLVKEARQQYIKTIKLNPSLKDDMYDEKFGVK